LVNLDDPRRDILADLEHVLDLVHALLTHLRDVHKAVDVVLQADKRAEDGELGDLAGDQVAHLVILVNVCPRVFRELLDADRNALVALVDFQHHSFSFVAFLEDLGGVIDLAGPGNIRDVDHAVQTFLQFDERAITGKVANLAFNPGARRIFLQGLVPGIGFQLAHAQRNLLLVAIDAQHDDFNILSDLEDFGGMPDAAPAHVGDMKQPVQTIEIDERAEVGNILDRAFADVARGHFGQQFRAALVAFLFDQLAPGENDVLPVLVDFDDLEIVGVADIALKIAGRNDV